MRNIHTISDLQHNNAGSSGQPARGFWPEVFAFLNKIGLYTRVVTIICILTTIVQYAVFRDWDLIFYQFGHNYSDIVLSG